MEERRVSEAVIRRLPRYYRELTTLADSGVERISSLSLAQRMRLNASQVRQDFNCFGGFGQQGYGYNVSYLLEEIETILGLDRPYSAVVVGCGNLGRALVNFEGFSKLGFEIRALFDVADGIVGTEICGHKVLHVRELTDYIRANGIETGIITARRSAAQAIADRMTAAGVKGIWNFAPFDVTSDVPVENVHLNDSLMTLMFKMKHN